VLCAFGQKLGLQLYVAIPAGSLAYFVVLVVMGLGLSVNLRAKSLSDLRKILSENPFPVFGFILRCQFPQ
jgi:hypothetical protein